MIRTLIGLLIFTQYCFSQDQTSLFTTLLPSGEAPKVLVENWDALYLQEAVYYKTPKSKLKKGDFSSIHKELYNSGTMVYGDPISNFTSIIVEKIRSVAPDELPLGLGVFTIKSKAPIVYLDGNKSLVVSTGLFSQLTSPDQLAFFICKAITYKIRKDVQKLSNQQLNSLTSIASKLDAIRSYSDKTEFTGDVKATELMKLAGFSLKNVHRCIDIIRYADQPFEDVYVPTNYFNSSLFYVPTWFFDVNKSDRSTQVTPIGAGKIDSVFQARFEQLEKLSGSNNGIQSTDDLSKFKEARKLARLETIRIQVIEGSCQQALYSILIMEKEAPEQLVFLSRMKVHAWLGLVEQGLQTLPRKKAPSINYMLSEGQRFYKVIRRFTTQSKMAYALRLVADMKATATDPSEYEVIQNRLLDLFASNKLVSGMKFADCTFAEFIEKAKSTSTDKYEKLDEARANNLVRLDTSQFYLFGLSDYMKNDQLKSRLLNGKDLVSNNSQFSEIQAVNYLHPVVQSFTRKSSPYSQQTINENLKSLSNKTSISLSCDDVSNAYSSASYIERVYLSSIYGQLFEANNYATNVILVDSDYIKSLKSKTGGSIISLYRNYTSKSLNWEAHYLLCFLVIPAPFIIPEMLLKRNKTWVNTTFLNTKNGTVDFVDNQIVYDPMKLQTIKSYSYTTLMKYKNHKK